MAEALRRVGRKMLIISTGIKEVNLATTLLCPRLGLSWRARSLPFALTVQQRRGVRQGVRRTDFSFRGRVPKFRESLLPAKTEICTSDPSWRSVYAKPQNPMLDTDNPENCWVLETISVIKS
ncbi:MAG: hypothetical protein NTY19_16655 [Planctomycetota bacterium]|nr:hypothetical protein [Planctomycetota bacterium]